MQSTVKFEVSELNVVQVCLILFMLYLHMECNVKKSIKINNANNIDMLERSITEAVRGNFLTMHVYPSLTYIRNLMQYCRILQYFCNWLATC